MPPFVETILFIFALIVIGYGAAALGLLKAQTGEGLSTFVVSVALPMLLFRTLLAADFGSGLPWGLWIAYFSGIAVTWTLGHITIRQVFGRDARAGVVAGVTSAFANLVLLGLPLIAGIYGPEGLLLLSLIISIHLVILMAVSMLLFEWAQHKDGVSKGSIGIVAFVRSFGLQLIRNPLIVGILCGLIGRLIGLELPSLGSRLVNSLADIAAPLALFAMGMSLRNFGLAGHLMPAAALTFLKLMVMPTVVLVMALILNLPPLTAQVAVVSASMPAGVNSWLIANKFNTGQRLASTAMTMSTPLAALSTLFWVFVAAHVFGG
jgi:malonate transporter and related proteins